MTEDQFLECVGGPCNGRWVSVAMGDRWPAAIYAGFGKNSAAQRVLGDYVLDGNVYRWVGGS